MFFLVRLAGTRIKDTLEQNRPVRYASRVNPIGR
jgi:hypothetical protein